MLVLVLAEAVLVLVCWRSVVPGSVSSEAEGVDSGAGNDGVGVCIECMLGCVFVVVAIVLVLCVV